MRRWLILFVLLTAPKLPAEILVVSANGNRDFQSIQDAIDAAPIDTLIRVEAGTYRENIFINKSIRLVGAGWNQTRVELPGNTEATMEATWEKWFVELEKTPREQRQAKIRELANRANNRPLLISGDHEVSITGMGFHWVGPHSDPAVLHHLVEIKDADVQLEDVAIIGSTDNGLQVHGAANIEMKRCLVAGNRGRGIVVTGRNPPVQSVRIIDCDVRHNYLSHIVVYAGGPRGVEISGCRLYGTAFFGIRPGSNDTLITRNAIFDNARTAFYNTSTSLTIKNNLILNNAFGGMSAWDNNRDLVENNTFVNNADYGIVAIATAKPRVRRNIFVGHKSALQGSISGSADRKTAVTGDFEIEANLFFENDTNLIRISPDPDNETKSINVTGLPENIGSVFEDPGFVDPRKRDYRLKPDSVAIKENLGAAGFPSLESPFPVQPEERALIPDSGSWDFSEWKKLPKQNSREIEKRFMALMQDSQPEPKRPDISYNEAFRDLFEMLGRSYPNFALKSIDWDAVGSELLPRAGQVKTDEEFGRLCYELVARLEDSHAFVRKGSMNPPSVDFPAWDAGFACIMDDRGNPVIYHISSGSPAAQRGVKVGMTVVSINGKPAADLIEETINSVRKFSGYSSDRYLRYLAARWFSRQETKNATVRLVTQDTQGTQYGFSLKATLPTRYLPRLPVPNPGIRDSANVSWKMLDRNIGLIYVRRIPSDLIPQLDKAVGELRDAKGLIVDVRGNSGGGFDFDRSHTNFVADPKSEPDRPRFTGPMALLIDSRCISAGEGWASWFVANKRAKVFGTATAGASARKTTYTLKNGLFKVTFPVKAYKGYLTRVIERRGLEPDVALRQTASDLAAGRDTVLEAARIHLLQTD